MVVSNIFGIFTPKIGEDFQFDEYFSDGLKPPTSFEIDVYSKKSGKGCKDEEYDEANPIQPLDMQKGTLKEFLLCSLGWRCKSC